MAAALSGRDRSGRETWEAWCAHWRDALDEVGREVADGHAAVRPMEGACRYCAIRALCRIETGLDAEDDDGEGPGGDAADAARADAP